jgi:hypothetical protein
MYLRFVRDLWQVGGFLQVIFATNNTDSRDITAILLKGVINTIAQILFNPTTFY